MQNYLPAGASWVHTEGCGEAQVPWHVKVPLAHLVPQARAAWSEEALRAFLQGKQPGGCFALGLGLCFTSEEPGFAVFTPGQRAVIADPLRNPFLP